MRAIKERQRGRAKRVLLIVAILLALVVGGSVWYVQDYYHADARATSVFAEARDRGISVTVQGDLTLLTPDAPNGDGLIFYPGGKVEETAYLPLLEKLCARGITCALVRMPLRLAVLGVNRADAVYDSLPDVAHWYIGGHSLGGAMASSYARAHAERIEGLVLLAAYPTGAPTLPTIALYGSEDGVLDRDKLTAVDDVWVIPGGNHAGFGNYGAQSGDGAARISSDEQQDFAVEAICGFVSAQSGTR